MFRASRAALIAAADELLEEEDEAEASGLPDWSDALSADVSELLAALLWDADDAPPEQANIAAASSIAAAVHMSFVIRVFKGSAFLSLNIG